MVRLHSRQPSETSSEDDDSAELWTKAAIVGTRDRATSRDSARATVNNVTPRHIAKSTNQCLQPVHHTASTKDETQATNGSVDAVEEHRRRQGNRSLTDGSVSTLPQSRGRRQPISDVAPASSCRRPLGGKNDQQRVEVVKPLPRGAVASSNCLDCEQVPQRTLINGDQATDTVTQPDHGSLEPGRGSLETFRPVKHTRHSAAQDRIDHSTDHHNGHNTDHWSPRGHTDHHTDHNSEAKSFVQQPDTQHSSVHHHHHLHRQRLQQQVQEQQVLQDCRVRSHSSSTDDYIESTSHILEPIQQIVQSQVSKYDVDQTLDRKWTENGTSDLKWRKQVKTINFYLSGYQSNNVIKPEVTSDRKHVRSSESDYVTSPLPEVGVAMADQPIGSVQMSASIPFEYGHDSRRSAEGELARQRDVSRDRMKIMIEQLNSKHPELQATGAHHNTNVCGQVAPPGELHSPQTPPRRGKHSVDTPGKTTPVPLDVHSKIHRQSSVESPSSLSARPTAHPLSANRLENNSRYTNHPGHEDRALCQHVPSAWTPVKTHDVSPGQMSPGGSLPHKSCPQLLASDVAIRRQLEYEAGLRVFGPNYEPQHSSTGDQQNQPHCQRVSTGLSSHTVLYAFVQLQCLVVHLKFY